MTKPSSRSVSTSSLSVVIIGAGRVGSALGAGLRSASIPVTVLRSRGLRAREPRELARLSRTLRRVMCESPTSLLCVLAVRDADIADVAARVADAVLSPIPIVHTAGAFDRGVLAGVAARGFPTAQMHPLLSFVQSRAPVFRGATLLLDGHPEALRAARRLARGLGFVPRVEAGLPRPLYHAAAALLANGGAALTEAAVDLLTSGGVDRPVAVAMASPLLASVVGNLLRVGLPEALSGPVRRGDVGTVEAHWEAISSAPANIRALYRALVAVQIDMARAIAEARPADLDRLDTWVGDPATTRGLFAPSGGPTPPDQIKVPQSPHKAGKRRAKS